MTKVTQVVWSGSATRQASAKSLCSSPFQQSGPGTLVEGAEFVIERTPGLDQRELARLLVDANLPQAHVRQASRGMAVGQLEEPCSAPFSDCWISPDEPEGIPILAPMIQREIL